MLYTTNPFRVHHRYVLRGTYKDMEFNSYLLRHFDHHPNEKQFTTAWDSVDEKENKNLFAMMGDMYNIAEDADYMKKLKEDWAKPSWNRTEIENLKEQKESIEYPKIYGFKTPEKHGFGFIDGDIIQEQIEFPKLILECHAKLRDGWSVIESWLIDKAFPLSINFSDLDFSNSDPCLLEVTWIYNGYDYYQKETNE